MTELTETKPINMPDSTPAGSDLSETYVYRMLSGHLEDRYIWVPGVSWHHWDGTRWEPVSNENVREAGVQWVREQYEFAKVTCEHVEDWEKYQRKTKVDTLLTLAKGVLEVRASELDSDPDLLNCANGTVDLRTGELRQHDPRDYITKTSGHAYTPGACHDDWDKALEAVPEDVRDWVQVKFGQGITGHTPDEDRIVFLNGGGANGKSTIVAAIGNAIGDYYHVVAPRALLGDGRTHTTELADFRGARFAVLEELPDKGLSVTRVKNLAGTPKITARHIAKDSIVFDATHTMFVTTNHYPAITETDHGTWRRLALVRFPYRFVADPDPDVSNQRQGDRGLRQRITEGNESFAETVLAWLVEGARTWYDAGQITPELPQRIADDTMTWRTENDVVLRFWNDCLESAPGVFTPSADLYLAYTLWAERNNLQAMPDRAFLLKFGAHEVTEEHGVTKGQNRTGNLNVSRHPESGTLPKVARGWHGIALMQPQSQHLLMA